MPDSIATLDQLALQGKRVLIRQDLNVPLREGRITAWQRIDASVAAIRQALDAGAGVLVMSHLGRPQEGQYDPALSLEVVAAALSERLGRPVPLLRDYLHTPPSVAPGEVALLENVRFNSGEKANDSALARQYAALADVFCMDAFATAHRAEASTEGVGRYAAEVCAGPLLAQELEALSRALSAPARPLVAIVGGAKVSTKLAMFENLLPKVDALIIGGGMANTFLAAQGHPVGASLHEADLLDSARDILVQAAEQNVRMLLPKDVITARAFSAEAEVECKSRDAVLEGDMILDFGPNSVAECIECLQQAGTIVWNGPVGVFEFPRCAEGTRRIGEAVQAASAFSIAGGGDTLAAVTQFGLSDGISYLSTGGGAFMEFMEGKTLPAVAMLQAGGAR